MINIKRDKTTYKIPSELKELTLGIYQKIMSYDTTDQKEFISKLINITSGMPFDIINKMPAHSIKVIANAITVMINDVDQSLQEEIIVDGVTYQFEENLDALRFDQFIDLSEMTDNDAKINKNLHLICAILYHKVIGKKKEKFKLFRFWKKRKYVNILEEYNTKNLFTKANIFKEHLTLDVIFGLLLFFSHLKLISLRNSLDSLKKKEEAQIQE